MSNLIPDLDSLRINHIAVPAPKKRAPRHKAGEKFLGGPVPLSWLASAAKLPGKALHVTVALWFFAGLRATHQINFPMRWLKTVFGVNRTSAYRGLVALEKVGLVSVLRHRGRASIVTLLEVDHAKTI
jgi:hypothetical protein